MGTVAGLVILHGADEIGHAHARDGGAVFVTLAIIAMTVRTFFRLCLAGGHVTTGLGRKGNHQASTQQQ